MIYLFNTLSRKREEFKPIENGKVGIYSCGPTVYSEQHIGNMRSMLLADFLRRMFEFNDLKVKHVLNYTDVGHLFGDGDSGDDKVESAVSKEGLSVEKLTAKYISLYEKDSEKLNALVPWKRIRATEHIKEQIELIKKLEKKGFTYKTPDGIYFDTSKMKDYGKLAGFGKMMHKAGFRVSLGDKKHSTDFALWKFSDRRRLQEWDSPWGIGFPGWHIECSAMSMKYLGERFDVHTGGQDLSQVHHNNEIAQSECATGKKFVNYWVHGGFVQLQGEKVSKSKGNFYTVADLENEGYDALAYRYLCLLTHYKKPLNFSFEIMDSAQAAFDRIVRKVSELHNENHKGVDRSKEYSKEFANAVNADLNLPEAVQVFLKALNDFDFNPKKKLKLLEDFDEVLGIGVKSMHTTKTSIPADIKKLVDEREKARKEKNWRKSDELRKIIAEKGYEIQDLSDGPKIARL